MYHRVLVQRVCCSPTESAERAACPEAPWRASSSLYWKDKREHVVILFLYWSQWKILTKWMNVWIHLSHTFKKKLKQQIVSYFWKAELFYVSCQGHKFFQLWVMRRTAVREPVSNFVDWSSRNHLLLNFTKTKEMVVDCRRLKLSSNIQVLRINKLIHEGEENLWKEPWEGPVITALLHGSSILTPPWVTTEKSLFQNTPMTSCQSIIFSIPHYSLLILL